jgi:hypothetical protein
MADIKQTIKVVNEFVEKCLATAKASAKNKVAEDAEQWWRVDYRSRFFYAIIGKELELSEPVQTQLLAKASELGAAALKHSLGYDIHRNHAALASVDVNCPIGDRFQDWCN